jgi:hypothetical protein
LSTPTRIPQVLKLASFPAKQLLWIANLDTTTFFKHYDNIKVGNRVKPVGDGNDGVVCELGADDVLDICLGVAVDTVDGQETTSVIPSIWRTLGDKMKAKSAYLLVASSINTSFPPPPVPALNAALATKNNCLCP